MNIINENFVIRFQNGLTGEVHKLIPNENKSVNNTTNRNVWKFNCVSMKGELT